MEKLISKNKIEPIKHELGFQEMFIVDSGGLTLLWKGGTKLDVTIYSRNHTVADAEIFVRGGGSSNSRNHILNLKQFNTKFFYDQIFLLK